MYERILFFYYKHDGHDTDKKTFNYKDAGKDRTLRMCPKTEHGNVWSIRNIMAYTIKDP